MKQRFATVSTRCACVWTNGSGGCSRRRRRARLDTAAGAPGRGRPGSRAARSSAGFRGLGGAGRRARGGGTPPRPGGGRPALTRADPTLLEDLRGLLESTTLGDPTRPLIWVSKSHAKLALALEGLGHRGSATRIPQLLER